MKKGQTEMDQMVEKAVERLSTEKRCSLEEALRTQRHLVAVHKGDLGQTNDVQHRINTGIIWQ